LSHSIAGRLAVAALLLPAGNTHSAQFGGTWIADLHLRSVFDSDVDALESDAAFLDGTALELDVGLSEQLHVLANLVLETVEPPAPGADQLFDGHGLFAQELMMSVRNAGLQAWGGKFNANFGRAWSLIPGIYRKTLAGAYEFTENLGIGAGAEWDAGPAGLQRLRVSTFFADDSELGHSLLSDRGHVRRSDGGVGNSGGLDSFSVSLDGGDLGGLNYHFAYSDLARGTDSKRRQHGCVASIDRGIPLADGMTVTLALEAAHFDGWQGGASDSTFVTPAAELTRGPWSLIAVWSGQWLDGDRDEFLELTGAYRLGNGLKVHFGWVGRDIGGIDDQEVGMRFYWRHAF
jgi:hypothetical protein